MYTIDMIKYITLIRVFKKRDDQSKYDYLSHRLESMANNAFPSWWNRNKTGKFNEGFDVFKSNKEFDHQALEELKLELNKIYFDNKDNLDYLNSLFEKWINDNFTKIEFEVK